MLVANNFRARIRPGPGIFSWNVNFVISPPSREVPLPPENVIQEKNRESESATVSLSSLSSSVSLPSMALRHSSPLPPAPRLLGDGLSLGLPRVQPSSSPCLLSAKRRVSCSSGSLPSAVRPDLQISSPILNSYENLSLNFPFPEQFPGRRPYTSVMIVPTGVGAAIGGYAGDALPVARALASVVDCFISHPNVSLGGAHSAPKFLSPVLFSSPFFNQVRFRRTRNGANFLVFLFKCCIFCVTESFPSAKRALFFHFGQVGCRKDGSFQTSFF